MSDLNWLLIDSEWSYAIYYGFPSKKPQYMPARNIKHRQFCTNASWKWRHESSIQNVSVLDDHTAFEIDFRNDRVCALALHNEMMKADVIVAHNADFDIKMLNVIFVLHGFDPIPEKKVICTLKIARKYFRFAGNGLDDLLRFFGLFGKEEKPDWVLLTEGDPEEIKKSVFYCDGDVAALDKLLFILLPYMIKDLPRPRDKEAVEYCGVTECDACGSKRLRNRGQEVSVAKPYVRIKCLECGHPMKGDYQMWKRRAK